MFELIDEWGPEKIVCVSDARIGMRGVLVIDNTARGMGKGGTRMAPSVTVEQVARLARNMTWKWAGVDLFYGGAKAGIQADPTAASQEDVLPEEYVFGLDVGLTEADAAIMLDEAGRSTVHYSDAGSRYTSVKCGGCWPCPGWWHRPAGR